MNFTTTVFKQRASLLPSSSKSSLSSSSSSSTTTVTSTARMTPSIAISTSAHFATKTIAAKPKCNSATLTSQSMRFGAKRTTGILMESNKKNHSKLLLNQLTAECENDKRLLELLTLVPDEPLYPTTTTTKQGESAKNAKHKIGSHYHMQVQSESTTSTVASLTTSSIQADDFENLPPSTHIEAVATAAAAALNSSADMATPPGKQINHPQAHLIQRDLNSPSANNRLRAIRALKDPSIKYYNFDVPHEEQDIITEEDRLAAIPKTIQEVLKDVVVYVEVRYGVDNRTAGVKNVISRMGAKVNDRLLKNTTHVIFKDGLQSTYNKAKSWNIPIVSILWIEACRNHLCVMDPRAFPISNLDQWDHPWLYGKVKRVKPLIFGSDDKLPVRKTAKAKLLDDLQQDEIPPSPKTTQKPKSINALPSNGVRANSRKSLNSSNVSAKRSVSASQSRKTINGHASQTKNTIKSMFQKQLEKSQSPNDSISDKLAAIDLKIATPTPTKTDDILVAGSLHKRVTRRNSVSSLQASDDECEQSAAAAPRNKKPSRKTMFTPRISDVVEEDKSANNKTVNRTTSMVLDATTNGNGNDTKANEKNSIIVDTPTDGVNQKQWLLNSLAKRKTFYTPKPVDETSMLESRMTPLVNRTCMRLAVLLDDTPKTQSDRFVPQLEETPKTPYDWSKGMPTLDTAANGDGSASKTLIDEYVNTFSSRKVVVAANRRTLSHVSMDIINQRIENLNRNASMHRTRHDSLDNRHDDHAAEKVDAIASPPEELNQLPSTCEGDRPKPLKRKLFAPPSMFSPIEFSSKLKTDSPSNKTVKSASKRNRDVLSQTVVKSPVPTAKQVAEKRLKKAATDADNNNGNTIKKPLATKPLRRSTMFFQSAEKVKSKPKERNVNPNSNGSVLDTPKSVLVFTNMHQSQVDAITKAVEKLGKFVIEPDVSGRTTHVVTLENRRTINLLRGIIRGAWILNYDWIVQSLQANVWQSEELYEMKTFSKAVEISRVERQLFGSKRYTMDIFAGIGPIFISPNCRCNALAELIKLCRGKITRNSEGARIVVADRPPNDLPVSSKLISSNWILDSISNGKLLKQHRYRLLTSSTEQVGKTTNAPGQTNCPPEKK